MARVKLPLLNDLRLADERSVERMRERLGGRVGVERFAHCGELVMLSTAAGPRPGVILTRDDSGAFVWTAEREVRRVPTSRLDGAPAVIPETLSSMAAEAARFGALEEGASVAFPDARGALARGTLVEKCRFGALVRSDDGALFAIGFQSLRPAEEALH